MKKIMIIIVTYDIFELMSQVNPLQASTHICPHEVEPKSSKLK